MIGFRMYLLSNMAILGIYIKFQWGTYQWPEISWEIVRPAFHNYWFLPLMEKKPRNFTAQNAKRKSTKTSKKARHQQSRSGYLQSLWPPPSFFRSFHQRRTTGSCPGLLRLSCQQGFGKNQRLVGGFNPSEKYLSSWIISPSRDENKKSSKPPPRRPLQGPNEFALIW